MEYGTVGQSKGTQSTWGVFSTSTNTVREHEEDAKKKIDIGNILNGSKSCAAYQG